MAVVLVGDQEVGWQWQPCAPGRCRGGSVEQPLPGLLGHGQHRHRALGEAGVVVLLSVTPAPCQCGPESAQRHPQRLPTVPLAAQTPSEPCGPEQDRGAEDAATHPEGQLLQCDFPPWHATVPAELSPNSQTCFSRVLPSPNFLLGSILFHMGATPKSWSHHLFWP